MAPIRTRPFGLLWILCLVASAPTATVSASEIPPPYLQSDTVHSGLKPGDVIRVQIWREPDLSGDFVVDANSRAVLPLLGSIETKDKTAEALIDGLLEDYSRFLKNPSIQITVLRRVSVQGEVRNPGLYPVDATVSVSDVIALAGGLTQDADAKKIYLLRQGTILDVQLQPEMVIQKSPIQSGDQVLVGKTSWFERNAAVLIATTITAAAILIGNALIR